MSSKYCVSILVSCCTLSAIGLVIGLYILWKGISNTVIQQSKILIFFKRIFFISIIAYLLLILCYILYSTSFDACYSGKFSTTLIICGAFFYHCLSLPSLLITLVGRLHYVFDQTVFRTNPHVLRTLCVMIAINISISVAMIIFAIYFRLIYKFVDQKTYFNILEIFAGSVMLLYFLLSVIMIAIFIRKLNQLILLPQARNSKDQRKSIHLTQHQSKLVSQVSKYVVIFLFAFSTTFLKTILMAMFAISKVAYDVNFFFAGIDAICNIMCVYLQFSFASDDYSFVCGCCDRYIKKRFRRRTKLILYEKRLKIEVIVEN